MTRHGHDGPGAVAEQDVVGNEYRDLLAVSRIGRIAAQEDAGLGLILLAFQIRLRCDRPPVAGHRIGRGCRTGRPSFVDVIRPVRRDKPVDQFVLRRQDQVGGPEQGVRSRREHLNVGVSSSEEYRGAGGSADPVALHGLDLLRPVQHIEILEQAV